MFICPFRLLTGLDCPLCGGQRMVWAILNGNITEAFHYNPLLFCLLPVTLIVVATNIASKRMRRRMQILYTDKALIVYLLVLLLWGIVRNIYDI